MFEGYWCCHIRKYNKTKMWIVMVQTTMYEFYQKLSKYNVYLSYQCSCISQHPHRRNVLQTTKLHLYINDDWFVYYTRFFPIFILMVLFKIRGIFSILWYEIQCCFRNYIVIYYTLNTYVLINKLYSKAILVRRT